MRRAPLFALATAAVLIGGAGCNNCADKHPTNTGDAAASASASPSTAATLIYDASVLNASTLPQTQIEAEVNRGHLPAYAGPTGSVEGTIKVLGPPAQDVGLSSATFAQCPGAEKFYGKAFREGDPTPDGKRALGDAIVIIAGYSGFFVPEKNEAESVDIVGCGYATRTIVMTFGQRLEVKNLTNEFWTPMLEPAQRGALMMAPPRGDAVKLYPHQAGRYLLVDHDRRYVTADLMVVLQPLHAVTDAAGHYRIDGIPVGHRTIAASHPQIGNLKVVAESDVDIKEGVIATVDLTLNYTPPPPSDAGKPDAFVPYPGLH